MRKASIARIASSAAPWAVIAALLAAGLSIKPKAVGATIQPPVLDRAYHFYGIDHVGTATLWAVGSAGRIVRSDDKGAHWSVQRSGTTAALQDIVVWDAQHAAAVGNQGIVLRTEDGGKTWRKVDVPVSAVSSKLLRVRSGPAPGSAWAVGEMGFLYATNDFGATWERKRPEEDIAFNDIACADVRHCVVVGEGGAIFNSMDGGQSWDRVAAPVKSSLTSITFKDAVNGAAVGLEGVILHTQDGGRSWQSIQQASATSRHEDGSPLPHLYDVAWDAVDAQWVAVGEQGVIVRWADGARGQSGRLAAGDFSWHTRVVPNGESLLLAGQTLGTYTRADDVWRAFSSR